MSAAGHRASKSGATSASRIVVLSGGVGGARLVDGLAAILPDDALTVIVNTGDDFVHWGLTICPDLDTVMYTVSGLADETRGWGLRGETFQALAMMTDGYGGPAWFQLGDRDLATHISRTAALQSGHSLSQVTARLTAALGIRQRILPMTDAPRGTRIDTRDHGCLPFQEWFVRERCAPVVQRIWFEGAREPAPEVIPAIGSADLVIIGPSNPYVSIDPILTLAGVREALARKPVIALSPIIQGRAVKGPLAEMITALTGKQPSARAIAEHYGELVHGMVVERGDELDMPGLRVFATDAIMSSRADRARLAGELLAYAEALR